MDAIEKLRQRQCDLMVNCIEALHELNPEQSVADLYKLADAMLSFEFEEVYAEEIRDTAELLLLVDKLYLQVREKNEKDSEAKLSPTAQMWKEFDESQKTIEPPENWLGSGTITPMER